MSILLETTAGNFTIDLFTDECPETCKNFIKLCKLKYYNNVLFYNVQQDFVVQTGDPTGTGRGGSSLNGILYGDQARFFEAEIRPDLRHSVAGTVSMAVPCGSQFLITTRNDCSSLDDKYAVFGRVVEGMEAVSAINEAYCDTEGRPFADVRVRHTYVLVDPFPDPPTLGPLIPPASPQRAVPEAERVAPRLSAEEAREAVPMTAAAEAALAEEMAEREARSRAVVLEMIGDLPSADAAPPENVLFVAKLNPVTSDADLELIFSRFGDIVGCDIVRDWKTGASLCYGFIEFSNAADAEAAYFKMDAVLIDDRRIRVDFSQSVSQLWNKYRRGGKRQPAGGGGSGGAPPTVAASSGASAPQPMIAPRGAGGAAGPAPHAAPPSSRPSAHPSLAVGPAAAASDGGPGPRKSRWGGPTVVEQERSSLAVPHGEGPLPSAAGTGGGASGGMSSSSGGRDGPRSEAAALGVAGRGQQDGRHSSSSGAVADHPDRVGRAEPPREDARDERESQSRRRPRSPSPPRHRGSRSPRRSRSRSRSRGHRHRDGDRPRDRDAPGERGERGGGRRDGHAVGNSDSEPLRQQRHHDDHHHSSRHHREERR